MEKRIALPKAPSQSQPVDAQNWNDDKLHQKMSSLVRDLVRHNIDLHFARKELEALYICEILRANNGNIGSTAKALGMHRNTLSRHIKELKIDTNQFSVPSGR